MGNIMKNAPNGLIWAVTLCFCGILAAFVILSIQGADTADLRSFLNLVLNIASGLFSGGALVVAGAAARSSARVEEQTNGVMDKRIVEGAKKALREHEAAQNAATDAQVPPNMR